MRASALAVLLPLLANFVSAAPYVTQSDLYEQDDDTCEMVWVTVYETAEENHHHSHHHHHATGGVHKHTDAETSSTLALPFLSISLAPGSGGEKGHLPPAPTATGSGSHKSAGFDHTKSPVSGFSTAISTSPSTSATETAGTAKSSSTTSTSPSTSATEEASTAKSSSTTSTSPSTSATEEASTANSSSSISTSPSTATSSTSTSTSPSISAPKKTATAQSSYSTSDDTVVASTSPTSSTAAVSPIAPTTTSSASAPSSTAPTATGKFTALVAFGDNLSDNGNGSVAHHVAMAGQPDNKIYGASTWTNGPVAVSYLTDLLHVPMTQNFAFGHAWGGSDFGATIDNTIALSNFSSNDTPYFHNNEFDEPSWGAPSAKLQIQDYITSGVNKEALHFLWIGNNDINLNTISTVQDAGGEARESTFCTNVATKIAGLVSTLLTAGAPYVFVANLYPKDLAPITPKYYYMTTPTEWAALGTAINKANLALAAELKQFGNQVLYYDAYTFMSNLYANPGTEFPNEKDTNGYPAFCDGDPDRTAAVVAAGLKDNWDMCVTEGKQDEWYWMQYLDPTSHVHQLVAEDMAKVVAGHTF